MTKTWIAQLVLALMFLGHTSYRNIVTLLKDVLNYDISLGAINAIFTDAVEQARKVNDSENLSNMAVSANLLRQRAVNFQQFLPLMISMHSRLSIPVSESENFHQ